jgi:hypothetical protein
LKISLLETDPALSVPNLKLSDSEKKTLIPRRKSVMKVKSFVFDNRKYINWTISILIAASITATSVEIGYYKNNTPASVSTLSFLSVAFTVNILNYFFGDFKDG